MDPERLSLVRLAHLRTKVINAIISSVDAGESIPVGTQVTQIKYNLEFTVAFPNDAIFVGDYIVTGIGVCALDRIFVDLRSEYNGLVTLYMAEFMHKDLEWENWTDEMYVAKVLEILRAVGSRMNNNE